MTSELKEWIEEWRRFKETEEIYLLPTSGTNNQDVLIILSHSPLSFLERLDQFYPPPKRKPSLQVYPVTREELARWGKIIHNTLSRARLLWSRKG